MTQVCAFQFLLFDIFDVFNSHIVNERSPTDLALVSVAKFLQLSCTLRLTKNPKLFCLIVADPLQFNVGLLVFSEALEDELIITEVLTGKPIHTTLFFAHFSPYFSCRNFDLLIMRKKE